MDIDLLAVVLLSVTAGYFSCDCM